MERNPTEWLTRLEKKLEARRKEVNLYENYYEGNHALAFATEKFREAFGSLFGAFSDNWCGKVVDSSVQRLNVDGFAFGDNPEAAEAARNLWDLNDMDTQSTIAHTEAVKHGVAYVLVDPTGDTPRITVEHPGQVIVECDSADRRTRLAALKKWKDDEDYYNAIVYLPDGVHRFRSASPVKSGSARPKWESQGEIENTLGVVPMIPLENAPTMLKGGMSDLKVMISLNDAVNKLMADMMVASEFQAFRQRIITGIEVAKDPETGEPLANADLRSAISRWIVLETDANGEKPTVTELSAADLTNYTKAVETLIHHIAALTATPPHYLMGQVVNASGDALAVAEQGLVFKVKGKHKFFGGAWAEVIRLCFVAEGRAPLGCKTLWADPEVKNPAQLADAITKLVASAGLPVEVGYKMLGASDSEIERWKTLVNLPKREPDTNSAPEIPVTSPE